MIRAFLILWSILVAGDAWAHPLAPSLLDLQEADGGFEVVFRTPTTRVRNAEIAPVFPEHCDYRPTDAKTAAGAATLIGWLDCGERGLVGYELGLDGLAASRTNALLRWQLRGEAPTSQVLDASHGRVRVQRDPGLWAAAWSYGTMGFWHVLGGLDHLLFVSGLLLLANGTRMLVGTVTAFTLGHSLTLIAAALLDWRLPQAPVELAIAASLVWLALVLVERTQGRSPPSARRPGWMAFGFGLFHGLGFAGALGEAGLAGPEIPVALASFNLGIEAAQLVWVCALICVGVGLARLLDQDLARARPLLAYAMGGLAVFWLIERMPL